MGAKVMRGLMGLAVLLFTAAVADASSLPGTVCGFVYWESGQPVQGCEVAGTMTDQNGWYQSGPLSPGVHEIWTTAETCCLEGWSTHQTVTVVSGQATRADFTWIGIKPNPVEVPELPGAPSTCDIVCNDDSVLVTMTFECCTVWPVELHVSVALPPDNRHTKDLFVGEMSYAWVSEHIEYVWTDDKEVAWAYLEAEIPWDTTVCYNESYEVHAEVWFANDFCGDNPEIYRHDAAMRRVRNCLIKEVETNAGNPDYLFYDPHHEDYAEPTVDFTIEDEGERVRGPYRWTVFFRPTGYMSWDQGGYGWVQGTAWGPGEVNAVLAQGVEGQDESTNWLGDPGTYAIEISIEEMGEDEFGQPCVIDDQWYKWPYRTYVPITIPNTQDPGHDAWWEDDGNGNYTLKLSYYLTDDDDQEPTELFVHVVEPDFEVVDVGAVDKTLDTLHTITVAEYTEEELETGYYRVVLMGTDAHGDDIPSGPYWYYNQPKYYREGENHRLMAVNKAVVAPALGVRLNPVLFECLGRPSAQAAWDCIASARDSWAAWGVVFLDKNGEELTDSDIVEADPPDVK